MFASVAGFEFRYQLRQPIFWIVTSIFFLLAFGLTCADQLLPSGNNFRNAPYTIVETHLLFSLIFMLVTTALVANPVLRDDETGFGPIIRVTRISKFVYIYGRFSGAFAAASLCLMSIPAALLVGSLMPWLDPHTVGPMHLQDYAFAYFLMALPSVWFTSTLFFTVATVTRSMMWTYLSVLAVTILYLAGRTFLGRLDMATFAAVVEPFGLAAFSNVTKFWTTTDRNTLLPALDGVLLWNRLLFVAVGFSLLAVAYSIFSFAPRGIRLRRVDDRDAELSPRTPRLSVRERGRVPCISALQVSLVILRMRTRMELGQVFKSAAFPVLLALSIANALGILWHPAPINYGVDSYPLAQNVIDSLRVALKLVTVIVAIYYAGELVWRDRERRMHEIIDSTPAPDWSFVVPKTLGILLALISVLLVSVLTGIAVQLFKGYMHIEIGEYLTWYVFPTAWDMTLLAILALVLQVVAPSKFAGWGLMVLYFISRQVAHSLGFDDNLFNYGGAPEVALSTMNGVGTFERTAVWFQAYWSAFAIVLLVLAYGLWRRGSDTRFAPRWMQLKKRLAGSAGVVALVALLAFAGLGSYIFRNTHIWNDYRSTTEENRYKADVERTLQQYRNVAEPSVADVVLNIDLDSLNQSLVAHGRYVFVNRTGAPLERIFVSWNRDAEMRDLKIEGARLERAFDDPAHSKRSPPSADADVRSFHDRIYRFDRPMASGEQRTLEFDSSFRQHGFKNDDNQHFLVDNGSLVTNGQYAPFFGPWIDNLEGEALRRKYGLPAVLPKPKTDLGRGWDMAKSDITVSTVVDQTPLAPGYKVSDVVKGSRRTVRFVTDTPITTGFPVVSARYLVKEEEYKGVNLAVYYDYRTPWNVQRMMAAVKMGLDYYQANFSPYQFRQFRIIEIPTYWGAAVSFANTIPYAESLGFVSDQRDPTKIDYVGYVTAHELAHQWWAHQVIPADAPGGAALTETLAQYSALMVMEKDHGQDKIRRFLRYELDDYLSGRGGAALAEPTLAQVTDQGYVYYKKGSLVMYLLRDQLGEKAVNAALHNFLLRFAFKGVPYPATSDLIAALRAEADPQHQDLITDLFERVTLYDLRTTGAATRSRADGRFDVTLEVEAKKLYANGNGDETESPLDEDIDVGLFSSEPGLATFDAKSVILMEKTRIHSGRQSLRFTVDQPPAFAGVDPYNKWIDRNPEDNFVRVVR